MANKLLILAHMPFGWTVYFYIASVNASVPMNPLRASMNITLYVYSWAARPTRDAAAFA